MTTSLADDPLITPEVRGWAAQFLGVTAEYAQVLFSGRDETFTVELRGVLGGPELSAYVAVVTTGKEGLVIVSPRDGKGGYAVRIWNGEELSTVWLYWLRLVGDVPPVGGEIKGLANDDEEAAHGVLRAWESLIGRRVLPIRGNYGG
jgi:hypothetical protein